MVSEEDLSSWLNALSLAVTPLEVAVAVAEVGADAADASFANLAMLDPDTSWVRLVHRSSLDPDIASRWIGFPISARTPLCEAMQTGQPVLLGSLEAIAERYPNLEDDTLAASLSATASLPLRAASGATLGAAGFAWQQPQAFKASQVERLDLIARLAALALDRALLHERASSITPGMADPADDNDDSAVARLTERELAVLQLLAVGYTNTEIALLLGMSLRTIETTRANLRERLGIRTHAQFARYALERGLTAG